MDEFDRLLKAEEDIRYLRQNYNTDQPDYEAYKQGLQDVKRTYPNAFEQFQRANTDQTEDVLNTIEFGMDDYRRDPLSNAAIEKAKHNISVPFGSDISIFSSDGTPYYGAAWRDPRGIHIAGGHEGNSLKKLIRHEAMHNFDRSMTEGQIRAMDNVYHDYNDKVNPEAFSGQIGRTQDQLVEDSANANAKLFKKTRDFTEFNTPQAKHDSKLPPKELFDKASLLKQAGVLNKNNEISFSDFKNLDPEARLFILSNTGLFDIDENNSALRLKSAFEKPPLLYPL